MITGQEELTKQLINSMQSQLMMNEVVVCAIKSLQKRMDRAEYLIEDIFDKVEGTGLDLSNPDFNPQKRFEI